MQVKDDVALGRYKSALEKIRLVLLCGSNITRCQSLADEMIAAYGRSAERIDLTAEQLSADPSLLKGEASAISMFGERRYILVRLQGREVQSANAAILQYLDSDVAGDPVFVIAAGMSPTNALGKRIAGDASALLANCQEMTADGAARAITDIARENGLALPREIAAQIADMTSNDIVMARLEVEKIALYLDADTDQPKTVDDSILQQLGAPNDEEDLRSMIHASLGGDTARLAAELSTAAQIGFSEIGLVRLMLMHLMKLAAARALLDGGARLDAVLGNRALIYGGERQYFQRQLPLWSSRNIERLIEKLLTLEIQLKSSGMPEHLLLEQELLNIARRAARLN